MKKNPFSRLVNHKIMHKVGKQWIVLSASLIFLLSGATFATHTQINASQAQVTSKQPDHFNLAKSTNKVKIIKRDKLQPQASPLHQTKPLITFNSKTKLNNLNHNRQINQNKHINSTKAIHDNAQHLHNHIIKNTIKVNRKIINPKNGQQIITVHRHYTHKRKYHKIKRYRTNNKQYYINTNRRDEQYGIPYGKLGYFKKDNSDEYSNVFSDLGYIYKGHKSKIFSKAKVRGYNFDLVKLPYELHSKYWLLSDMLSNRKNRYYNPYRFNHFINTEDNSFLNKHFDSNDIDDIKNARSNYQFLMKHENQSSTRATPSFRQHVIDWINFYRQTIFKEYTVNENSNFDSKAQYGANTQQDQEDMNWGNSDPSGIVRDYVTDAADEDNDGETGHRDSVLDPQSAQVGVGQRKDVNSLFFHWGFGNTATNPYYNIDYPKISDFPIDLAKNGEFWSINNPRYLHISSVNIHIKDKTTGRTIPVKSTKLNNCEVYIKVNPNKLHTGHTYKIYEDYTTGNGQVEHYWYNTQFYNINPMNKP